jgi:ATP-dependent DNA helicase RecQ
MERPDPAADSLLDIIRKHWGYTSLRPFQHEAMTAAVNRRDSLVVLPTGGGKSLCYQAPALLSEGLTVVVSPLIALMKDQVDALIQRGIDSAFLNSSLESADRRLVIDGIRQRAFKLVFVAPERFASEGFYEVLQEAGVGSFAIDEAHCISHWGHDFRVDYRQLGRLKERFPQASVHAFTATATPRVREDIIVQLGLRDPVVLVGDFFRPNLHYRLSRRARGFGQVIAAIQQRRGQAGIVYCIRRADVDELTGLLEAEGIKAVGYHAGMGDEERTEAQEAFSTGKTDVVVATVAFGMGIDRADIRYVIHAAMPKSIEHYQQETGRAGRDGKPAECILFYSGGDFGLWKNIIEMNDSPNHDDQVRLLSEMYRFCTGATCRHHRLVSYFGQEWNRGPCGSCDICAGSVRVLPDSTVMAQKILSCVVRTEQRHGAGYVADVLLGKAAEWIVRNGHDKLTTFGLIPDRRKRALTTWMDQLVDQEMLRRNGQYEVLTVTPKGWQVLRGKSEAILHDPGDDRPSRKSRQRKHDVRRPSPEFEVKKGPERAPPHVEPAEPHLDTSGRTLFEKLRVLRRTIATERGVPAFMVFSDKTLREIARARPTSKEAMLAVNGVGPAKYKSFGERFVGVVKAHLGRVR